MISEKQDSDDFMHGLGPNERALLERIPFLFMRKIAAEVVRTKMRLQFTGWLQYLLPVIFVLLFASIGGIAALFNVRFLAIPFLVLAALIMTVALFDLVTVKFRLRFPERLPKRNDDLELFDLMRARRSCRSFQTRKLTDADFNELIESVRIHTEEPQIGGSPVRFEYISAPITVWPVVNATEFLVAIVPLQYDRFAVIDVGRSLQKVVMDATRMGLGTCWIGPGQTMTVSSNIWAIVLVLKKIASSVSVLLVINRTISPSLCGYSMPSLSAACQFRNCFSRIRISSNPWIWMLLLSTALVATTRSANGRHLPIMGKPRALLPIRTKTGF